MIEKIEGLGTLVNLATLNLSHNRITKLENLETLVMLKNLDVSHNQIADYHDLEGALALPELTSLDVSSNQIEEHEGFVEFMTQFQQIMCLYFKGNPFMRKISKY